MAVNYFLKIDGIAGESTNEQHKGEIEIHSWSWGGSNSASSASNTGAGPGKANLSDLALIITLDGSTPPLFRALTTGTHIPTATLSGLKSGGGSGNFFTLHLTEVSVASLQVSAAADIPVVSVALAYKSVQIQITGTTVTGAPGQPVSSGWDLTKNAAM